jgi:hypothetical protein
MPLHDGQGAEGKGVQEGYQHKGEEAHLHNLLSISHFQINRKTIAIRFLKGVEAALSSTVLMAKVILKSPQIVRKFAEHVFESWVTILKMTRICLPKRGANGEQRAVLQPLQKPVSAVKAADSYFTAYAVD